MSLSQVGANIMNAKIRTAEIQGQARINAAQTTADALSNIPRNILGGMETVAKGYEARERIAEARTAGNMRSRMQSMPVTDEAFASATTGLPQEVIGTIRAMSPQNMYELASVMQGLVPYWKARNDLFIVTKTSGAAARLDGLGGDKPVAADITGSSQPPVDVSAPNPSKGTQSLQTVANGSDWRNEMGQLTGTRSVNTNQRSRIPQPQPR